MLPLLPKYNHPKSKLPETAIRLEGRKAQPLAHDGATGADPLCIDLLPARRQRSERVQPRQIFRAPSVCARVAWVRALARAGAHVSEMECGLIRQHSEIRRRPSTPVRVVENESLLAQSLKNC